MPSSETAHPAPEVRIEVHLAAPDAGAGRDQLRRALGQQPRTIPSKYFYDDRGSALFEAICELPEYYQTRTEAKLLASLADRLVRRNGVRELVELGSGAATKTRILLDAMARADQLDTYVPVDISEGIVRRVADELVAEYPGLAVHGLVADFLTHLGKLPDGSNRLVVFLGGTIGNLHPDHQAPAFLRQVREAMSPGDFLVLGTDLIKDPAVIEAAYNDAQGVTAAFNLNILRVVNDQFGADFDLDAFTHRAFYDRRQRWIEMRLVSRRAQTVTIPAADLRLALEAGEEIRTEISTKYDRRRLTTLLDRAGLTFVDWYTDPDDLFALSVASPG